MSELAVIFSTEKLGILNKMQMVLVRMGYPRGYLRVEHNTMTALELIQLTALFRFFPSSELS